MMRKKFMRIGLSATLLTGVALWAFTALAGPSDQIIEGAKKEGTVSLKMSNLTPKSIKRLEGEIKKKFGVDLDIKYTPTSHMPKEVHQAIMEHKTGMPPTYDLLNFSRHVVDGNAAGALEVVDWKPLITGDTNPEVVHKLPQFRGAITIYTANTGLIYNPEKVPANEVPKSVTALTDPKWKGKVAIPRYSGSWTRWAYILGKEKTLSSIRGILKNGGILGTYSNELSRYMLGEVWMAVISSSFLKRAWDKGMPAAFDHLEFANQVDFVLSMQKGALHPNAAKLVAVYLASPAGSKFILEESGAGNLYYPGNYEHDLLLQAQKAGLTIRNTVRDPEIIAFETSPKYKQWVSDVRKALKGQ